jgi:chromosome segregation ATPase
MAKIIEVTLPDEYKDANRYEIFHDLEKVATYAHNLKQSIEDLKAEVKLRDAQLQKQRADIMKLKSWIGLQNLKINDLEVERVIEDIEVEIVEEKKKPNFIPTMEFQEVTGSNLINITQL